MAVHPLFWSLLIFLALSVTNMAMYSFLSAPDSYSMLSRFEQSVENNQLYLDADSNRWAFAAFITSIHLLSKLTLFNIFKYLFPLLSLLVLPPLWLLARRLSNPLAQYLILFTAAISPTVMLELDVIRQQTLFLFFLYFALGLLDQASQKRDSSLFLWVGFFSFLGSFVYPLFIIFSITWIFALAIRYRAFITRHWKVIGLTLLIATPFLYQRKLVSNILQRFTTQVSVSVENFLSGKWNLWFPAKYINSDSIEMSWPGFSGVMKFYGFYAGPLVITLLAVLIFLAFKNKKNLLRTVRMIKFEQYPIALLILFFFLIAEVAPRFANHAYLPDRAWQYLSILMIYPLFLWLKSKDEYIANSKRYVGVGIILISIGIGAALYINYLTSFKIPDYELRASEWIKENLPDERIFFTSASKYLLLYHAQSQRLIISDEQLQSNDIEEALEYINRSLLVYRAWDTTPPDQRRALKPWYNNQLSYAAINYNSIYNDGVSQLQSLLDESSIDQASRAPIIERAKQLAEFSDQANTDIQNLLIQSDERQAIAAIKKNTDIPDDLVTTFDSIYIYYAQTHPRNPYSSRPYESSFTTNHDFTSFPIIDNNPDIFESVYTDGDYVRIWKVKL